MIELPRLISVDDHVIEPAHVFTDRLPAKYRDVGPRVVRKYGTPTYPVPDRMVLDEGVEGPGARWCDLWLYEDLQWPLYAGHAQARLRDMSLQPLAPVTFDDFYPGCYEQAPRLEDMDTNYVEAALCFPTFARFCGQTFSERPDKELALLCVQAYNDWMIDEWCGGAGHGRLIPLTLIPLWDPELAAAEVRRCAAKGSRAIAFSENPSKLGYPSIHSRHWDPLFAACEQTQTVINMHIGSSSTLTTTSPDAPLSVTMSLTALNAQAALVDWLVSGVLARFANLRIALSEGQIGWMPYVLERVDSIWERGDVWEPGLRTRVPNRPSSYMDRIYGCIFEDLHGLASRDIVGMKQIMWETDYPHADSTYPHSRQTAEKHVIESKLDDHEIWQLVRGNAIECYDLARFGIAK
ncbi:MAG TPA: amidohydrolase family protein [Jatrophihabitantaceae bacterium]|jgi:predicted TIM-barrel fold metal-dependent hydrolase|nr:amidohydrolase family protein [Jatrophihabitantaceae bacterium]